MDTQVFSAISLLYLDPDTNQYVDEIRLQRVVVEGWLQRNIFPEGQSMLVRITNPLTGIWRICSFVTHSESNRSHVFIPGWILENLGLNEHDTSGQEVTIQPFTEDIPQASLICLKPMDNAIYHTDIRECFEQALDRFHVLSEGTMLKVCIPSLGDYEISAYVDKLEPASIVRLGGEVHVEFLEPDGGIPEFVKPEVPVNTIEEPIPMPIQPDVNENEKEKPDYKAVQEAVRASWLKKFKKE